MAGLGLVNALDQFQQGRDWHDQQQVVAQQKKQRDTLQAANAAGAAVVQQAQDADAAKQQQAWTDAGNDPSTFQAKPFAMDPQTLLTAMHARGDTIAKSGDLNLWTQNEAATAPVRNTIRQQVVGKALADYDATGDGAALAQAVYPTVHDGIDIKSITTDSTGGLGMQGASAAAAAGQPVKPAYNITLSNGQTHTLTGDQIASMAHDAILDPSKMADYEFQSRLQTAKNAGQINVDAAKAAAEGNQARQTEGVKGANALKVEGLRSSTALQVGQGNNAATIGAAGIRGDAEKASAGITADGRIQAAGLRAAGGPGGMNKVQKTLVDSDGYVVNVFKDGTMARATVGGAPVRSSDYGKRLDAMKKTLRGTLDGSNMTEAQLTQAAQDSLAGGAPSPAPKPGLAPIGAPPASGAQNFSHLWGG